MNNINVSKFEIATIEFLPEIIRHTLSNQSDSSIAYIIDGWMALQRRCPGLRMLGARGVDDQGKMVSAAYLCEYPGDLGVLVGPWVAPWIEEPKGAQDRLPNEAGVGVMKLLLEASVAWGIEMVQAINHHDTDVSDVSYKDEVSGVGDRFLEQQKFLSACGMTRVTTLIQQVLEIEVNRSALCSSVAEILNKQNLQWIQFIEEDLELWVNWMDSSYVETMDCPELNGFRTTSKTIKGYQSTSTPLKRFSLFDENEEAIASSETLQRIEWWGLRCNFEARCEGIQSNNNAEDAIAAGVLLSQVTDDHWELTYMGVGSEYRGNGLGKLCIAKAVERTIARGGKRIFLAMDERNSYGASLYEAIGFKTISKMDAWIFSTKRDCSA